MSKKSPHPENAADTARRFLRAAAAPYFPQAVTWPAEPRHRAVVDGLLRYSPRMRDSIAAAISMALEEDLTVYLPPCAPIPRYAPGMAVIVNSAKEYIDGEFLFIAGGALGWDKGIRLKGEIGESLPDNGPGGAQVRLATEAETDAALASLEDAAVVRIARLVIAGTMVSSPKRPGGDDPFDMDNL